MFSSTPNPVAFNLFGIPITWYGILVATGILIGGILIYLRGEKFHIKKNDIIDIFLFCVPMGIVGARLYYVIFNWDYYSADLTRILLTREGGLAIHGGLILGIITGYIVCLFKKIVFFNCLDLFVPSIALAQAIGRWGNYFNSEAYGTPTSLPWGINIGGVNVHPTFLYESLWCFGIFIFLIIFENRRKFAGQLALLYGCLYSVERFFVEGLRTDSLMIGPFRQAQLLSVLAFLLCLTIYLILRRKK